MFYPEAFKDRVRKVYPNNIAIKQELEKEVSDSLLILFNEENLKLPSSIAEIKCCSTKELEEQQKIMAKRAEIYIEFLEIYKKAKIG